jgi:hypothetical protein
LTLTTVHPARSVPNIAIGYCRQLGSMMATRAPLARPFACSQAANWRESASSSAKLIVFPMLWYAGRSPYLRRLLSHSSTSEPNSFGSMSAGTPGG